MSPTNNRSRSHHACVSILAFASNSLFASGFQVNHHSNGEHILPTTRDQSNIPTYLTTEATATMINPSPRSRSSRFQRKSKPSIDTSVPIIRLHMIRHGETMANVEKKVLGQGDSPLTEDGVRLAQLAASSDLINGKGVQYWRAYCSDLNRAHRTAKIILGLDEDGDPKTSDLIVDSQLREVAKGAKEGFPKNISYEEAMASRMKASGDSCIVPKLESSEEAWDRVKGWIDGVVEDVSNDFHSSMRAKQDNSDDDSQCIYDVFALSHSALIRTMVQKIVDDQDLQPNLPIPNLSRTIIEVQPQYESNSWTPTNVRLTDVSHLLTNTQANASPPYL